MSYDSIVVFPFCSSHRYASALCILLSVAVAGLALNPILCRAEEDDSQTMECCRGAKGHCHPPDQKNECCNRHVTDENPLGAILSSTVKEAPLVLDALVEAPSEGLLLDGNRFEPTWSRKFPLLSSHLPLTTPLRI